MRKALFFVALLALVGASGVGPEPSTAGAAPPPFHGNQGHTHPGSPANAALPVSVTSVSGTLPPGLSFVSGPNTNQVTLTGTPTATGPYTFTVELGGTYVLGTISKQSQTYTVTIF